MVNVFVCVFVCTCVCVCVRVCVRSHVCVCVVPFCSILVRVCVRSHVCVCVVPFCSILAAGRGNMFYLVRIFLYPSCTCRGLDPKMLLHLLVQLCLDISVHTQNKEINGSQVVLIP